VQSVGMGIRKTNLPSAKALGPSCSCFVNQYYFTRMEIPEFACF